MNATRKTLTILAAAAALAGGVSIAQTSAPSGSDSTTSAGAATSTPSTGADTSSSTMSNSGSTNSGSTDTSTMSNTSAPEPQADRN